MIKPAYYHCSICEQYHAADWDGDCRQDDARFNPEDLDARYPGGWDEIDPADIQPWRDHQNGTLSDFLTAQQITAEATPVDYNPNMDGGADMDHWRVVLRRPGRKLTVYFSMGSGHHGKPPEAAEVLDCLASDAAGVANAPDFADWCSGYGYDTDSRKAHRTYTICVRQAERLQKFLGTEAYEQLLWKTERI